MLFGFLSPYIIAFAVALVIAHSIKYGIAHIKGMELDPFHQIFATGGMPSSHAATVMAVWVVILCKDGIDSGLFGLVTLLAAIVMMDAVKVRRSTGEQGVALRRLLTEQNSDIPLPHTSMGHTPVEVAVGAILGAVIGVVVFLATK